MQSASQFCRSEVAFVMSRPRKGARGRHKYGVVKGEQVATFRERERWVLTSERASETATVVDEDGTEGSSKV